ncbi:MAG: hypothetical protein RBS68_02015 [Anaerolineales bacterium]|nr:hypothetical protein [Anaerolineales bacterium]
MRVKNARRRPVKNKHGNWIVTHFANPEYQAVGFKYGFLKVGNVIASRSFFAARQSPDRIGDCFTRLKNAGFAMTCHICTQQSSDFEKTMGFKQRFLNPDKPEKKTFKHEGHDGHKGKPKAFTSFPRAPRILWGCV